MAIVLSPAVFGADWRVLRDKCDMSGMLARSVCPKALGAAVVSARDPS